MKRVFARNGMKTCWSCGSSEISVCEDEKNEGCKYFVRCADCGEHTLNCQTEKLAKKAWNRAYEVSLD